MLVHAAISGDTIQNSSVKIVLVGRKPNMNDPDGLYELLGVDPNCSDDELRLSAKERMLETHPDSGGDPEEFMAVHNAYEILSNRERRASYNDKRIRFTPYTHGEHVSRVRFRVPTKTSSHEPIVQAVHVRPDAPYWRKESSDMLSDGDVRRVETWHDMLMDAARDYGVPIDIEAGISSKVRSPYSRCGDIAVIAVGVEPDVRMARSFMLMRLIEVNSPKNVT